MALLKRPGVREHLMQLVLYIWNHRAAVQPATAGLLPPPEGP